MKTTRRGQTTRAGSPPLSDLPGAVPEGGHRGPAAAGWTLRLSDREWIPIATELALTRRERQIVRHVLDNLDPAAVGAHLTISPRTVRAHLEHVYRKLGLRNRCDLILRVFDAVLERLQHSAMAK